MINFGLYDLLQDRDNDEAGSNGIWDIAKQLDGGKLDQDQAYNMLQDYKEEMLKQLEKESCEICRRERR